MDVFEAVRTLLAVRSYRDTPVSEALVQKIVEAGRTTASAKNAQPWHFIVVQNPGTLHQLAALVPPDAYGPYIDQAPLAIVVALEKSPLAVADASRAIQSMLLTAWAEGVGANWVGFQGMQAINPLLNIPDDVEVLAILPFGYPAQPVGQGKKKRKPLDEVAHRERFGQPFA